MARGRLFRSPLLTFGTVEPRGVRCEWTHGLAPIGGREVAASDTVELHVVMETSTRPLEASARVRFDVLAGEEAASAPEERVVRLLGTGARAGGDSVPTEARTTVFQRLAEGETFESFHADYVAAHPTDFASALLVVDEGGAQPQRFHLLTWWATRLLPAHARSRFHFRVDVDGVIQAQTAEEIGVGAAPADGRTITVRLQREDESPLAEAEFEAVFERDQRVRGKTDGAGTATFAAPAASSEVFRLFLLSFEERRRGVPEPLPSEPLLEGVLTEPSEPPPLPVSALRPETVVVFAFDSAFPGPGVWDSLERVSGNIEASPAARVMVFGHTDAVGSDAYNQALSELRARAVLALLSHDLATFDEIAEAEGWDVAVYQSMLRGLGCNPSAIDGSVGAMTREATSGFQLEYNLGVYHTGDTPRAYRDLPVDGSLNPTTKAAIRDAYVAVSPHVRADRLADPQFAGCGERYPISEYDTDNRRAVVAYFEADRDLSQLSPCDEYETLVGEQQSDIRARRFSDTQWLREESGAVHLSAVTYISDGSPARITVVRREGPVPVPPPDSSQGGPVPHLGPTIATVQAQIRGGICFGRWESPEEDPFDPIAWLVDHDVQVAIAGPDDKEEPAEDDPRSSAGLLALDAVHPPLFILEAAGHWGVSGPPGQRLNRLRFVDVVDTSGTAVRTDGSVVVFDVIGGRIDSANDLEVVSVALAGQDFGSGDGDVLPGVGDDLELVLVDAAGNALASAPYHLYLADGSQRVGVTGSDGRLTERVLPGGPWQLDVPSHPSLELVAE